MLKHAVHVCLIAALVAGAVVAGYRRGVVTGRQASLRVEPPRPAQAVTVEMPGKDFALMRRPVERSIKLDRAVSIRLFGSPILSGDSLDAPIFAVRIDYGIPIASDSSGRSGGEFDNNVSYQF